MPRPKLKCCPQLKCTALVRCSCSNTAWLAGVTLAMAMLAMGLSGCGAKSSPPEATAPQTTPTSDPSQEILAEYGPGPLADLGVEHDSTATSLPPKTVAESPVASRASIHGGLNWSGARSSEPNRSESAASASASPLPAGIGNMIEVYYATDRLPTAQLMPSGWRTFAPVGVVWMICAALFIGFASARRFTALWLVGCGLAVCLGLTVFHATLIRWQQYSRLARNAETRFSAARDSGGRDYPLHLGSAQVSLPSIHKPGRFEQPKLYQFEFIETVDKHIVLHSLQEQDSSDAWFEALSRAAERSAQRDSFVFIHGYNVRFIDALKRTAQLACDLELSGPAICYSWPSRGAVVGYTADEASVSWSAPHFEQLLLDLRARTQCQRVHVIAHSMGNRALLQALERIDAKLSGAAREASSPAVEPIIDSLVMAAPDVDLAEFTTRYAQPLSQRTRRAALYFSDSDRALLLSAGLHGAPRLGLLRDHLQTFSGIESIYVGAQASLSLGHSYYGDDPAVIEDVKEFLRDGKPAADRELLRKATSGTEVAYWSIDRSLHAQRSAAPTQR
jgi:esterase/lipase superfamily enzyme